MSYVFEVHTAIFAYNTPLEQYYPLVIYTSTVTDWQVQVVLN